MGAEDILDEMTEKTGWNDQSKILILCAYIDNQKNNDAFHAFLAQRAKEEEDDDDG